MATGTAGKKIARCYQVVGELLGGKEMDRRAVADLIGVRVAAADRHIAAIVNMIPGITERRDRHHRKIRLDLDAVSGSPSRSMAVAACFGASLCRLFRDSAYESLLGKALEHVLGRVRKQSDFKDARRKFVFVPRGGETALPDKQGILDELVEAVLLQQRVALKYEHFDGTTEALEVAPWSIAIYEHQLYMLAEGVDSAPSVYRLARIQSATRRTTKTFRYPARTTYDPDVIFRDTFGIFLRGEDPVEDVVLRFDLRWRFYVRSHRWHASQSVRDDGKHLIVRMRVRTCPELEAFILGFGEEVEVMAPTPLRRRIAERAAARDRIYRAAIPGTGKERRRSRSRGSRRDPTRRS